MTNTFTNLPAPAANGVGAAVDLSALGASKTFIIDGSWGLPPTVAIEMNDDAAQAGSWVPVTRSFQGRGEQTVEVVGRWFRVRVSNYRGGAAPAVNCGSNDNGTTLLSLPVPALANGAGAAQASSTAGPFKTFCVQGPFRGTVNIEVSTDGATEWSVAATFTQSGIKNLVLTSSFVRAVRSGVPAAGPGTPIVTMASENAASGSGGSAITISANASSVSSGVIVFSNSYNVSFGLSGSTITASASGGAGGIAASAAGSSVSAGTVVFSNSNGVSFGMSGSTITASLQAIQTISGGSTFATGPAVVFQNSNGVSFGVSGNTVTGSISQTIQAAVNVAGGTQTATSGTVVFSNLNGLTFGMAGSSAMTGSFQAVRNISAGTTLASASQVVFSNANNVSFGANGGTITGSASFPAQVPFAISGGADSQSTGTVVFSNSNGVSFGLSANGVMTASIAAAAGGVALSAGTQSVSTGTVVYSNSNGVSFGMAGSTAITASFDGIRSLSAGTTQAGGSQVVFGNANGVSFGANGSTLTGSFDGIRSIAAGGATWNSPSISFVNGGFGISFATLAGSSIVGIQAAAYGMSTQGNTAGSAGTIFGRMLLAGIGGITLSQSTNAGQQGTLSIVGPSMSARVIQDPAQFAYSGAVSQGAMSLYRMAQPFFATVTQARYAIQYGSTTLVGSTEALVLNLGVYTMSGSTASLASSASISVTLDQGIVVINTLPGLAAFSGFTFNMTPGDYLIAHNFRSTNGHIDNVVALGMNSVAFSALNNVFNASNTAQFVNGYSNVSFSTALPSSINVTNTAYVRTGASANRQPSFQLIG